METAKILSPQEERLERGEGVLLTTEAARASRPRINRMLQKMREKPVRIAVERARLLTESFKKTESLPVVLRWAFALNHITGNIKIEIGEDELIVGRCGPQGRYGILYPELRGAWLEKGLESLKTRREGKFNFSDEDAKVIQEEIIPYWKGRTIFEATYNLMPENSKRIFYEPNDAYTPRYVVIDTTTDRTSLQWNLDYDKLLKRGLKDIKREATEKMAALDPFDQQNNLGKHAFLQAVIIACDAVIQFAKRHAETARAMAKAEKSDKRRKELLEIAEVCEWVPENPARNFREAVQSQWFAQTCSRFEQFHGGTIGNGRIDQYLYPFYKKDVEEGRLTHEDVLELLESLWVNMAQNVTFRQSGTVAHWEGVPHFEATTIGGQTRDGQDATNSLSYLIIQSKKEFPLDFPDLAARIHARTPEKFLTKICELIKEGTGFPKLINDEEIILSLVSKGGTLEEARDYAISGCTETRMLNRDIYLTGNFMVNFGAAVEMALNDGKIRSKNNEQLGIRTGDPRKFGSFDQVMNAFKLQLENLARHGFVGNQIADSIRPNLLAAPLQSSLHDLCMKNCVDIHQGKMDGAVILGSWDPIGFGTAVDSLAAIKKLVFDDKMISMDEMIEALENNFEGKEIIRQRCLNAPKYGNNDLCADSIGREVEDFARSISHRYTTLNGGKLDVRFVPITSHVPLGKIVWATPNGRKAKEPLSEGISPTQGVDHKGPTATLTSIARTKESKYVDGAARLLNLKLTPSAVAGDLGTKRLASLIRTWCDLKLWHIQFNIINGDTLRAAQKNPEKYTNLLVRVAGYSAYFVDLSLDLQNEIIWRTEHNFAS